MIQLILSFHHAYNDVIRNKRCYKKAIEAKYNISMHHFIMQTQTTNACDNPIVHNCKPFR